MHYFKEKLLMTQMNEAWKDVVTSRNAGRMMHVATDMQVKFCREMEGDFGTPETEAVTGKVADVAQAFSQAGVPTCWVYFNHENVMPHDLYKMTPQPGDLPLRKAQESAIGYTPEHGIYRDLNDVLMSNMKDIVLISCVNFSRCVKETALGAVNDMRTVIVLEDATADGLDSAGNAISEHEAEDARMQLLNAGVFVVQSDEVLQALAPSMG